MHLFIILLSIGMFCQQFTEGLHPYKPCNCGDQHKKARIKRSQPSSQIDTNLEPNHLPPPADLPGINAPNTNYFEEIPKNGETVPPNHLQWNIDKPDVNVEHEGNDEEIVGLAGLAHIHVLAARAKARAAVARARARARLHRPLLLETTPEEFLDDDVMDDSQNNFQVPDSTLSLKPLRRKLDHESNPVSPIEQNLDPLKPSQQTTSPVKPSQLDMSLKQHHQSPSFSQIQPEWEIANPHRRRSRIPAQFSTEENNAAVIVPRSLPNSARSVENYENNQFPPTSATISSGNSYSQPEIRVHNIDNSEEVYQNRKPGFSIIPTNWKPPPESNLYVQGEYEPTDGQEPILAVLPGKWTNDDGYDTYYYGDYDVIPIAYNIPEEAAPNYGRSSEPEELSTDAIPERFVGIKKQFQRWDENPMVWRPNSNMPEQQRAADPSDKRHFHHSHSHTFIHKHVLPAISGHSSGFQSHSSNFAQPEGHVPTQHSGFSHSGSSEHNSDFFEHQIPEASGHNPIQHSSFSHFQGQGQTSGFSHHVSHGHSITINNQKTMVVAPSDSHKNIEIAQVTGSNNAVSQSQSSSNAHQHGFGGDGFAPQNSNFQSAQVSGNSNSVSQAQRSDEAPFVGRESQNFVGAPYLINFPRHGDIWRTHNDVSQKLVRKRSVDDNSLDDDPKTGPKINKQIFDIVMRQEKLLKEIADSAKYDKELLFIAEIGSNLLDDFQESLKSHSIAKRTVPLLRLIADPNAKLDVPKTLENMGTVARNSFESKRAPMYHLKNVAGSAKDAFLSTLRIVPQDFIVPSRYKIIDRERESVEPSKLQYKVAKSGGEEVAAITPSLLPRARSLRERIRERHNLPKEAPARQAEPPSEPEDPYNLSDTYKKVGSMLRESVRSGQETLNHVGEIYHSTRKALATARHSAPRVILSSMRIPAVQRHSPLLPHNDKVLMIAPKILQLKQEAVGAPHYSDSMDDLVGVGNVMDSLGISKPDAAEVGRKRIVFHPATVGRALERSNLLDRRPALPNLHSRSNFAEDEERPTLHKKNLRRYFVLADTLQAEPSEENMQETMDALDNARDAVGASSLRDFVLQMKDGLSSLFKNKLEEARDRFSERLGAPKSNLDYKKVKGKVSLESGNGKHPITLKFKVNNPLSQDNTLAQEDNSVKFISENNPTGEIKDETVGAGLLLPKRLLTPFVGQPSKIERRQFFEELGDSEELSEESTNEDQEDHEVPPNNALFTPANNQDVIGAINPILFNKTFELCDNQSPLEFLAALNGTKPAHRTKSAADGSSGEHKCIYIGTTTTKTPVESSTKSDDVESTTKINPEEASDEQDHQMKHTTRDEEENTTKKIKAVANVDVSLKNQKNKTAEVRTSMKMGKALLTPFMGKPIKKEMHTYFDQYSDSYEEDLDEDEYLGNPRNPEQLQVLPNDGPKKKNSGSSRNVAANQQNNPLEQNLL